MDAYKIGVTIAMQNNVSSVLKVIQRDLMGLKGTVDVTQGSFDKMKLAALGAAGVFAGGAMLDVFKNLAAAGGAVIDAQNKILQLGISYRDVVNETAVAYKNIGIAGSTPSGNLDNIRLLYGVLGNLNAANSALAGFDKAQFVLNADKYGGAQLDQILKAMDIQGAFVNKKTGQLDPALFNSAIQQAIAAVLTTGGLLNGQQFYQATRLMGPAATAQTVKGYLSSTVEILASMGNRGARGLQDAAPLLLGGSMNAAQANMLERLHLLNPDDVQYAGGGRYLANTSKMKGGGLLASGDIVDWIHNVFLPAAAAQGLNPLQAGSSLTKPLAGVISYIASNWAQIVRSGQQQAQAATVSQYSVASNSYTGAIQNLQAALFGSPDNPGGLMEALGTPAAAMAIPWINRFTNAIRTATEWIGAHQTVVGVLEKVMFGLGAALTVLGTAAIVTALAVMVGTGGTIVLLAAGIAALGVALYDIPGAVKAADKFLQHLVYDLLHPSAWMHGTPSPIPAGLHKGQHWVSFGRGGEWVPDNGPSGLQNILNLGNSINNVQDIALKAMKDWIDAGAPTTVSNPGDIAHATTANIKRQLSAPNAGPTGFNGQASHPGSAASSGY